jgi:hypothetical protein
MNRSILLTIARLFFYLALIVLSIVFIHLDAQFIEKGNKFHEYSYTEWAQQVFALLSMIICLVVGRRFEALRPVSYLLAGGFAVIFIREMDHYFDFIYQGAWLPFALVALAVTVIAVYRNRKAFWSSVERFMSTASFGLMVAGGLSVFVFSRLFGSKSMWTTLFQVEQLAPLTPFKWAKNAVQEGSELFGYCLFLAASVELLAFARRQLEPSGKDAAD